MKTIYSDNYIIVKATGRNYDFIATIENLTDTPIVIHSVNGMFEEIVIEPYEWVGILANDEGYEELKAFDKGEFEIELSTGKIICGTPKRKRRYYEMKERIREQAINWSHKSGDYDYSYYNIYVICGYFEKQGRKYGLLREFKENGIC